MSSKSRWARIELGYYRKADALTRARYVLGGLGLVLPLLWVGGWAVTRGNTGKMVNHGVISVKHATWEEACDKCHKPFNPINGKSFAGRLASAFGADPRASDKLCQDCHKELADHHGNMKPDDAGTCASCHREHQGRDASLSAVADADCTRCHADLAAHASNKITFAPSIKAFQDHPDFALFTQAAGGKPPVDPGRLKNFSHKQHLTKGIPKNLGGAGLKAVGDLLERDRERYRRPGQKDTDAVQLDCSSCHRPAGERILAGDPASAARGIGTPAGAYMARASFERDCRACHELDFEANVAPVRHGMQPAEVREYLLGVYSALYLEANPKVPPQPQNKGQQPRNVAPGNRQALDKIGNDVAGAENRLLGGKCYECHFYVNPGGAPLVNLPANANQVPDFKVDPPRIPEVWLPHARFNHAAHDAVADCRKCHAAAFVDTPAVAGAKAPEAGKFPDDTSDVMIPKIESCRECHAPRSTNAGAITGGAGHGCNECHGYHGGDMASAVKAPGRASAELEFNLRQFLARAPRR